MSVSLGLPQTVGRLSTPRDSYQQEKAKRNETSKICPTTGRQLQSKKRI